MEGGLARMDSHKKTEVRRTPRRKTLRKSPGKSPSQQAAQKILTRAKRGPAWSIDETRALVKFLSLPWEEWDPTQSTGWPQAKSDPIWSKPAQFVKENARSSILRHDGSVRAHVSKHLQPLYPISAGGRLAAENVIMSTTAEDHYKCENAPNVAGNADNPVETNIDNQETRRTTKATTRTTTNRWAPRLTSLAYQPIDLTLIKAPRHLVFAWPPCTGETSTAKAFAEILNKCGLVKDPTVVTMRRDVLSSEYVNTMERRVRTIMEKSAGKVLLVDEVYQFGKGGTEAKKALESTMNHAYEPREKTPIIIIAGYMDEMKNTSSGQTRGSEAG
ncbi:Hypp9576 [Branchiostoma lanceolatum]|uniref:Hypp9576 protein n=1 Tax=Branchiostoma lanceolatum TaxID=7740 RepID=A0A8S4MP45_BRALA|nr:Hypp9576 [Branchiostoma lanceolatum]